MAKVKITGHASGSGVLTITAPNTSTDRTVTLPDATGTLLNSDGSAASLTAIPAAQITGTLPAINGASLTSVNAVNGGRKNLIINGGMDVWQRGTSFAHSNGKKYCPDRFWLNPQSVASTYARQAVTSPIAGMASQYCLRIQRNINVTSTGLTYFAADLESSNAFACRGRKLTLSFYARKHATGYTATSSLFSLGIVSGKGTNQTLVNGYTSGAFVANQSNTLTSSWQRFTVTTSSVIADDITQIGLQGTRTNVGTAGTNDYMEITGIQLEISDVATDFEHRSYGEELALCQRYYQTTGVFSYYAISRWQTAGGNGLQWFTFHTPMRAAPATTTGGTWLTGNSYTALNAFDAATEYGVQVEGNQTQGASETFYAKGGSLNFDAEL